MLKIKNMICKLKSFIPIISVLPDFGDKIRIFNFLT